MKGSWFATCVSGILSDQKRLASPDEFLAQCKADLAFYRKNYQPAPDVKGTPMRKTEVLGDPESCLNRADPLEPVFVLRAKDPLAAQAVRLWAAMAVDYHPEKCSEALGVAHAMDEWRRENPPVQSVPETAFDRPPQQWAETWQAVRRK